MNCKMKSSVTEGNAKPKAPIESGFSTCVSEASMFISLNGKREEVEKNMSISDLLEKKGIRKEVVTVEQNGRIIDKEKFKDTFLNLGDEIEFVYYMGGGNGIRISEFGLWN